MAVEWNFVLPILLGLITIIVVNIFSKRKMQLPKICFLFLMGSTLYGGMACLYLGFSGNFLFTETIDSYRLWISLAGLVLLWMFQDVIRKEMK